MLLQFVVENYACFADRVVLNLLAVPGEPHPEGQVVEVPGIGPVLRTLVLYGPNASGKSRLVEAFGVLRALVVDGVTPGSTLPVVPHKLDSSLRSEPTVFEVELSLDGVRYAYGIEATSEEVRSEWLHRVDGESSVAIFERQGRTGPRPNITIGEGLPLDEHRRAFYGFVAEGTRPEQPFLAELRARNAIEVWPLFDFFDACSDVRANDELQLSVPVELMLSSPWMAAALGDLLRDAGTGIRAIRLVADTRALQDQIDSSEEMSSQEARAASKGVRLEFLHTGANGVDVPLSLNELSEGTRRLMLSLGLEVIMADVVPVSFIDEIDRSFHTSLTRYLMQRLHNQNAQNQFVFTTHDTNLLDAGVFGRDAIWFVEKDTRGRARIYSLVEFQRAQLDALSGRLEQGYLQGRFGAIPLFGEPEKLHRSSG